MRSVLDNEAKVPVLNSAPTTLMDLLAHLCETRGSKPIFRYLEKGEPDGPQHTITPDELNRESARIASALTERFGEPESEAPPRVLLLFSSVLEFVQGLFGCLAAGFVPVPAFPPPVHSKGRGMDLGGIIRDAQPSCILVDTALLDEVGGSSYLGDDFAAIPWLTSTELEASSSWVPPELSAQRLALLQYTSGSTRRPRGVRLTHDNILKNLAAIEATLGAPAGSVAVNWLPPSHDMGLIGNILNAIYANIDELVLMSPIAFIQRPIRWLKAISHFRAWGTGGPNFAYELCARTVTNRSLKTLDLDCLELAICGAEPIQAPTLRRFAERFAPVGFREEAFRPCYGLAEATLLVSCASRGRFEVQTASPSELAKGRLERPKPDERERELVSCGAPRGEVELLVVDPETKHALPAAAVGEIWVSGPNVSSGYWRQEDSTTEVFGAHLEGDLENRYLRTGDLGTLIDGQLYVTGRLKDIVIVRGQNYDAHDLEAVAEASHRTLRPGRVVAFGEVGEEEERVVVLAEIVRLEDREIYEEVARAIHDAIAERVGVQVELIDLIAPRSLPRTTSGKLKRSLCQSLWRDRHFELLHRWGGIGADGGPPTPQVDPAPPPEDVPGEPSEPPEPRDLEGLAALVQEHIKVGARLPKDQKISPQTTLTASGLDSLGIVQLCTALSSSLEREVPVAMCHDDPTIETLVLRLAQPPDREIPECSARGPEEVGPETVLQEPEPVGQPHTIGDPLHVVSPAPEPRPGPVEVTGKGSELSIMFFASDEAEAADRRYELVLEATQLADTLGFQAVWLPERHFHRFGGLFPNPSVVAAAVAVRTRQIRIRAGSVVLPLHEPIRVAEEWSVVDNLSGGRVDLSFATGWDADSFVLAPDRYPERIDATFAHARTVSELWRGETVTARNGQGREVPIRIFPRPIQSDLNLWSTVTKRRELFERTGREGFNLLTALLFQSVDELAENIAIYRRAREAAGLDPRTGHVTLMLHAYAGREADSIRRVVRQPLLAYLDSSVDLWSREAVDRASIDDASREQMLELAFERYLRRSALIGDLNHCRQMLKKVRDAGVDEVAGLIDFGAPTPDVLESLRLLSTLNPPSPPALASPPGDRCREVLSVSVTEKTPGERLPDVVPTEERTEPPTAMSTLPDLEAFSAQLDPDLRHTLSEGKFADVFEPAMRFKLCDELRQADMMPFYLEFSSWTGTHATVEGKRVFILSALDYLGLACDPRVTAAAAKAALVDGTGRSGSRVHSGSTPECREMEIKLAKFVGREDAVISTTGYQAMAGVVTALMNPTTTLVFDEAAHASILDGASIARCKMMRFRHNDPDDLARTLEAAGKSTLVMVEGLYSNDGDVSPLPEIRDVCDRYGVRLALDDAHGLGVLGTTGRGTEEHYDCIGAADLIAGTFSKSLASIGGWIAADRKVIDWIRYHGRTILFTAAIAPPALAAASAALDVLIDEPRLVREVAFRSQLLRQELTSRGVRIHGEIGPVIRVPVGDDLLCVALASSLLKQGIYVHTVLYPSVPKEDAMIRLCISASHDPAELKWAAQTIARTFEQFGVEQLTKGSP